MAYNATHFYTTKKYNSLLQYPCVKAFTIYACVGEENFVGLMCCMAHPDQKYIDALLTNNYLVLEEAYRKFSGKIKIMVLQHNGTEQDAADIFQEAWVAIYNMAKQKKFILTGALEPYLYMVCKNKWLTQLQKNSSRGVTLNTTQEYNKAEGDIHLAEETAMHEARKNLLSEKMQQLGQTCRQLIHLSLSGKPMNEIAESLGVTYGYARKKKSECMARLSQLIKQAPGYGELKW